MATSTSNSKKTRPLKKIIKKLVPLY